MNTETDTPKRKWPVKRTIALSTLAILAVASFLVYKNFNRIIANSLDKAFESDIISDVYELKFEKLRVNPFEGSIQVSNVILQPREKPLRNYPYINSSFVLKTEKIMLKNVAIIDLLKSNELHLERILIDNPEVELLLKGRHHILLPFKDTTDTTVKDTTTTSAGTEENKKKTIGSFTLKQFLLKDASFHVTNLEKQREFKIHKFNIDLLDLNINQQPGKDILTFRAVEFLIGEFSGRMEKGPFKLVKFKDYSLKVDSLKLQETIDTAIFQFHDLTTGLNALDIQTADSIYSISMATFNIAYRAKSVNMTGLSFKPNVDEATLQKKHKYQHQEVSGAIGSLKLVDINFDSLIASRKIFINEIILDDVTASLFKDKTKAMDSSRLPIYLGQTIKAIPLPLLIKHVKCTNVNLVNVERKPDSEYAKVNIRRGTVDVRNITNLSAEKGLTLNADAYIEDKAHATLNINFDYLKTQFSFEGGAEAFNLPDLNALILAYTPAKINKGNLDKMAFSGIARRTSASGTMTFLYHGLEIDMELKEQAKWKSSVLAFTANTILDSSNPNSADLPPRVVKFQVDRDMNKGFVNIIMKSMLAGLKETMIMSKENKKSHRIAKRESKQRN
jgi:hypothetical protein